MQICFFTDNYAENLLPLTLTRPVDDLRVGIFTIREKWILHLNADSYTRICPHYLSGVFKSNPVNENEDITWINSQFLPSNELTRKVENLDLGEVLVKEERVIAFKTDPITSKEFSKGGQTFDISEFNKSIVKYETTSIDHLWDLLSLNASEIENDINLNYLINVRKVELPNQVTTSNPENIFLSEGASIQPGCIIMAGKGPVFIGPDSTIEAGSIIQGPVAICEGATIKMAARISDGTTVGPVCKVGGEVMNTIFHSYSNKAHDGFVGNSLFGQWCNLGADTNTSNLKNNYSEVKLLDWKTKRPSEEGIQFLGTVMGDHSKTAINTQLNTGTICGVCSNIVTSKFPPKYISSFVWMTNSGIKTYILDKAFEAMAAMMGRRGVELTSDYKKMMEYLFVQSIK